MGSILDKDKIVVVLSAKKKCGKSTVSGILVNQYGFERIAIADIIKQESSELTGINIDAFYDQNVKELYFESHMGLISPRKFMQWWGMFRRNNDGQNYWLDKLKEKINSIDHNVFVVEDVRLKFEADYLISVFPNSLMVRIDPYEGWNFWDDHITETDMDNYKNYNLEVQPDFGYAALQDVAKEINNSVIDFYDVR